MVTTATFELPGIRLVKSQGFVRAGFILLRPESACKHGEAILVRIVKTDHTSGRGARELRRVETSARGSRRFLAPTRPRQEL